MLTRDESVRQTNRLWTSEELCEWLQITPETLGKYRRQGLPFYAMPGGQVLRYDPDAVESWLASLRQPVQLDDLQEAAR